MKGDTKRKREMRTGTDFFKERKKKNERNVEREK
jgi:hypothetical protein